jgi:hypothetical protein
MRGGSSTITGALRNVAAYAAGALALVSCGGGGSTGSERNSGINKTYLSVEASDADGDALHYQWRVTSGSIENRDSRETVWTLPEGPGLHFAYVTISDGKGGWTEQQYAVASDPLNELTPPRPAVDHVAPAVVDIDGTQSRLRFSAASATLFAPPQGGTALPRIVYLPDVQVQIVLQSTGSVVFAGRTNARGELDLPKLQAGSVYDVRCATADDAPLVTCDTFTQGPDAGVRIVLPAQGPVAQPAPARPRRTGRRHRVRHRECLLQHPHRGDRAAAAGRRQRARPTGARQPLRRLRARRGGACARRAQAPDPVRRRDRRWSMSPPRPIPAGYVATSPIELSHALANSRPRIVKMVANGADGNVRGQMVEPEEGAASNAIVGADHFLTFKGRDTKLSGCMYYRALGAVRDCDAQGNMIEPISFADWKRKNGFGTPSVVTADYINQRDLNLVRRMVATRSSSGGIAFYVCNHPGPEGKTQKEIDDVIETGLKGERRVACVAMEYTTTTGANGGQPFTKFFTFLPSGELVSSVNSTAGARSTCRAPASPATAAPPTTGASPKAGRLAESGRSLPSLRHRQLPVLVAAGARRGGAERSLLSAEPARRRDRAGARHADAPAHQRLVRQRAPDRQELCSRALAGRRCESGDARRCALLSRGRGHVVSHLPRRPRLALRLGLHHPESGARQDAGLRRNAGSGRQRQHAERAGVGRPAARARPRQRGCRGADDAVPRLLLAVARSGVREALSAAQLSKEPR